MPRGIRLSPLERETADEIRALIRAQKSSSKKSDRKLSDKEKQFRGLIGPAYDEVINTYKHGRDMVDRAQAVWAKVQLEKDRRVLTAASTRRSRLEKKGYTVEQIARTLKNLPPRKTLTNPVYHKVLVGPRKGRYVRREEGKPVSYVSAKTAKREKSAVKYNKHITDLANKLGMTRRQSQKVYAGVRLSAKKGLIAFKKTKAYKALNPRQRRGMTQKRWQRGSLNALATMFDLYFEWA